MNNMNNMNKDPLVSVIVPVYNVERYIRKCIDSILCQSYTNIEIILVNDGSTDGSRGILQQYASEDFRCKLIDKDNGGASSARNIGLDYAKGEYVYFIDSDDYIEPSTVADLVDHMQCSQSDFCCYRIWFYNETRKILHGDDFSTQVLTKNADILKDALLGNNIKIAPWTKFFLTSFLNKHNIRFYEGLINEDYLFTIECAIYAQTVSFLNKPLYFAYERPDSVSRVMKDNSITSLLSIYDIIRCKYPNIYSSKNIYFRASFIKQLLYVLVSAASRFKSYKDFYRLYGLAIDSGYLAAKVRELREMRNVLGNKLCSVLVLCQNSYIFYYVVKLGRF